MSFRVALETKALRDIEKESRYQRREGGARAESRWRSHVERFQLQLEADPLRYPHAEEADALNIDLRELIVGKKRGTAHRDPLRENRILLGSSVCRRSDVYII